MLEQLAHLWIWYSRPAKDFSVYCLGDTKQYFGVQVWLHKEWDSQISFKVSSHPTPPIPSPTKRRPYPRILIIQESKNKSWRNRQLWVNRHQNYKMWHPNNPDYLETQLLWRVRLQFHAARRSSSKRRLEDNRGCQIKMGWEMLSILLSVQSRRAKGTWNLERHRALTQDTSGEPPLHCREA